MYINFWEKEEPALDLDSLLRYQEHYMRENKENPGGRIEFMDGVPRSDVRSTIRIARFPKYPDMAEYTGFVDFEDFVFMCVLFAPDAVSQRGLSKLRFVMRKVFPLKVAHERSGEA
jgi:hypothetical protein